ncbi:LAME_0F08570g1_1 [Lachancea meyersii CBS 8951]|uniref:LAME_0F08570g1_1 n=1 Tax=Lachancea meyersii CBS 8951 TaxID=1266667 RepID=A0A1G4JUV8_9SACH|nr:LAME_0F08570g1_1 [Lachancea meyersii CBS 8951]
MSSEDSCESLSTPKIPSRPVKRQEQSLDNAIPVVPTTRPLKNRTTGVLGQVPKVPPKRPIRRHTEELNTVVENLSPLGDARRANDTEGPSHHTESSPRNSQEPLKNKYRQNEAIRTSELASATRLPLSGQVNDEKKFETAEEEGTISSVDDEAPKPANHPPEVDTIPAKGGACSPLSEPYESPMDEAVPTSEAKPGMSVSISDERNQPSTSRTASKGSLKDAEANEEPQAGALEQPLGSDKGSPEGASASNYGEELLPEQLATPVDSSDNKIIETAHDVDQVQGLAKTETTTPSPDENYESEVASSQSVSRTSHSGLRLDPKEKLLASEVDSKDDTFRSAPLQNESQETPKVPDRPAKRAPPKKPSSKIAAFQEMLKRQQIQDQSRSKAPSEGGGQLMSDQRAKAVSNLNGIFGLPGMVGGVLPITQKQATGQEKLEDRSITTESTSNLREKTAEPSTQRRARGPKGRKLPAKLAGVEKVERERGSNEVQVFKTWSVCFQTKQEIGSGEALDADVIGQDKKEYLGEKAISEHEAHSPVEVESQSNIRDGDFELLNDDSSGDDERARLIDSTTVKGGDIAGELRCEDKVDDETRPSSILVEENSEETLEQNVDRKKEPEERLKETVETL